MFCIALKVIMEKSILPNDTNISIGGVKHTNGAYADDLGVIAGTLSELNQMLERIKKNSAEFGLSINMTKTEVMLIGNHDPDVIPNIDGAPIKVVDTFEYLGRILSRDGSDRLALNDRIGKPGAPLKNKKILSQINNFP